MEPKFDEHGIPRLPPTPGFDEFRTVIEEAIWQAAADWGLEVKHYAGRYMYGAECLGVVVDDVHEFVKHSATLAVLNSKLMAGELLAKGAATDSMATETIVYWPDLTVQ
jgi:hypothetical protein